MVEGIVIEDTRLVGHGRVLAFDLADVLRVLGEAALDASWRGSDLRYVSDDDREIDVIERLASGGVLGRDLVNGLSHLVQVIDGDFEATNAANERWVLVRAIDSSWWEVWSADAPVLHNVCNAFQHTVRVTTFIARREWGASYTLDQMR